LGSDGKSYLGLREIWSTYPRDVWYPVNREFWLEGMNGRTNDEAMIGDEGSDADLEASRIFLDKLMAEKVLPHRRKLPFGSRQALDVGAGAGRVTRGMLLKYADFVHLVDGSDHWLQQAKRDLGKKRAARCTFSRLQLQDAAAGVPWQHDQCYDIIWIQWVLQYLTDDDAITLLKRCKEAVSPCGVIVVKENHAEGLAKRRSVGPEIPFFLEIPEDGNGCFDITRPDEHHCWLFRCGGLSISATIWDTEVVMYALKAK